MVMTVCLLYSYIICFYILKVTVKKVFFLSFFRIVSILLGFLGLVSYIRTCLFFSISVVRRTIV